MTNLISRYWPIWVVFLMLVVSQIACCSYTKTCSLNLTNQDYNSSP